MKNLQEVELAELYGGGAPLFRGGFIAAPKETMKQVSGPLSKIISDRFLLHEIGNWDIRVAPDTPLLHRSFNGTDVLAIGDIFDNDGGAIHDRIDEIARSDDLAGTIARMDLGGRHAILIFRDNDVLAFNDPFGSRSVVFCAEGNPGLSSHASLLAMLYKMGPAIDASNYMDSPQYLTRTVRYLPGNRTAYEGIRRLPPNHLRSTVGNRMIRFWPFQERVEGTEEQLWERFDKALDALRTYVAEHYTPIIAITGGVDTRSIVSNFYHHGTPFVGVTWVNFNFKGVERPTIDKIAEISGQPNFFVTMPPPEKAGAILRLGNYNSGGIGMSGSRGVMMARCLKKMEGTYNPTTPPCFVMGYGGEIIRGFYQTEGRDKSRPFNAGTMSRLFGAMGQVREFNEQSNAFVAASFDEFFQGGNFSPENWRGYHPADLFYWEHRMGMWAALTMETVDPAMHCLVGINSRRLYEAGLNLPNRMRLSKEVIRRYISARVPEMGEIPVV